MKANNICRIQFDSRSVNESFSRVAVCGFLTYLDPTVEELGEIKTAVSEAVTNAIVHGYGDRGGIVYIEVRVYDDRRVSVTVRDRGKGIADVKKAREPLFTTDPEGERAGLGFALMETFMDRVRVRSAVGKGTSVTLTKILTAQKESDVSCGQKIVGRP